MTRVEKEITLEAAPEVAYQVWRNFDNFPSFMDNIAEVRVLNGNRSHWKAKEPLGQEAEWDAEITLDERGRALAWRSIEGTGNVRTQGRVDFLPVGSGGTRLHLVLEYESAAGGMRDIAAKIFANPEDQVEEDLRCFKEDIDEGQKFGVLRDGERVSAAAKLLREEARDENESAIREDTPVVPSPERRGVRNPYRENTPDRGHGTPGGSLGSLNETEETDQDRTSEKTRPPDV